jgi:small GTP-binding protein
VDKNIITGIIFSQFNEKSGPVAVATIPSDLSREIKDLISLKSINILAGEQGFVPKALSIVPFPSINLKGLIKNLEIKDADRRGGVIDSSITLLFNEATDAIFYKYINNFETIFDTASKRIIELSEKKAEIQLIEAEIEKFQRELTQIIEDLRENEISTEDADAFPMEGVDEKNIIAYRFKVIVCGDPMVGKTSTVLRFTNKAFKATYLPTIGVTISEKALLCQRKRYEYIIWDIAGQAKFQMMRRHFYQGADGILIVFDLARAETLESIAKWYQDVKTHLKKEIPGIIIGNKSDLEEKRKVTKEEGIKLAKQLSLDYVETSALAGVNVEEAFLRLGEFIAEVRECEYEL